MPELSHAILYGDTEDVIKLIQQGADVDAKDEYGMRPLIQASIQEDIYVCEQLLKHGAGVNLEDINGNTALYWATDIGNVSLCELLLSYGADPNHYSASGQPILVNPRLRGQQDIIKLLLENGAHIDFCKDYINAKLIGHRFELTGYADIVNAKGEFVEIEFEGFILEFTLSLIRESLILYQSHQSDHSHSYLPLISKVIHCLEDTKHLVQPRYKKKHDAHKKTIQPYLEKPMIVFPVAYQGHAITLIKYKDFFVKCDRGVSNFTDTVIIYKMQNPLAFNRTFIYQLLYESHSDTFIDYDMKDILSLTPIATLPTKSQISGNCSWANVEATLPAILFLLHISSSNPNPAEIATLKSNVMRLYTDWVLWDKQRALYDCITQLHHASTLAQKVSKAAILGSVLFQRCQSSNTQEIEWAKRILAILTLPEYRYILKSYTDVYCRPEAGPIGAKFTQLLLNCDFDLQTFVLNPQTLEPLLQAQQDHEAALKALHLAAHQGRLDQLQSVLHNYPMLHVNDQDTSGSTALMYASYQGHLHIVQYLIEDHNANPMLINDKGGSALDYAKLAHHQPIIDYLNHLLTK